MLRIPYAKRFHICHETVGEFHLHSHVGKVTGIWCEMSYTSGKFASVSFLRHSRTTSKGLPESKALARQDVLARLSRGGEKGMLASYWFHNGNEENDQS